MLRIKTGYLSDNHAFFFLKKEGGGYLGFIQWEALAKALATEGVDVQVLNNDYLNAKLDVVLQTGGE